MYGITAGQDNSAKPPVSGQPRRRSPGRVANSRQFSDNSSMEISKWQNVKSNYLAFLEDTFLKAKSKPAEDNSYEMASPETCTLNWLRERATQVDGEQVYKQLCSLLEEAANLDDFTHKVQEFIKHRQSEHTETCLDLRWAPEAPGNQLLSETLLWLHPQDGLAEHLKRLFPKLKRIIHQIDLEICPNNGFQKGLRQRLKPTFSLTPLGEHLPRPEIGNSLTVGQVRDWILSHAIGESAALSFAAVPRFYFENLAELVSQWQHRPDTTGVAEAFLAANSETRLFARHLAYLNGEGISYRQILENLAQTFILSGEKFTGDTQASHAAGDAASAFLDFYDRLTPETREALANLCGDQTLEVVIKRIQRLDCVETIANIIKSILDNNPAPHPILDLTDQSVQDELKKIAQTYRQPSHYQPFPNRSQRDDLGLPGAMTSSLLQNISINSPSDLLILLNFPVREYQLILERLPIDPRKLFAMIEPLIQTLDAAQRQAISEFVAGYMSQKPGVDSAVLWRIAIALGADGLKDQLKREYDCPQYWLQESTTQPTSLWQLLCSHGDLNTIKYFIRLRQPPTDPKIIAAGLAAAANNDHSAVAIFILEQLTTWATTVNFLWRLWAPLSLETTLNNLDENSGKALMVTLINAKFSRQDFQEFLDSYPYSHQASLLVLADMVTQDTISEYQPLLVDFLVKSKSNTYWLSEIIKKVFANNNETQWQFFKGQEVFADAIEADDFAEELMIAALEVGDMRWINKCFELGILRETISKKDLFFAAIDAVSAKRLAEADYQSVLNTILPEEFYALPETDQSQLLARLAKLRPDQAEHIIDNKRFSPKVLQKNCCHAIQSAVANHPQHPLTSKLLTLLDSSSPDPAPPTEKATADAASEAQPSESILTTDNVTCEEIEAQLTRSQSQSSDPLHLISILQTKLPEMAAAKRIDVVAMMLDKIMDFSDADGAAIQMVSEIIAAALSSATPDARAKILENMQVRELIESERQFFIDKAITSLKPELIKQIIGLKPIPVWPPILSPSRISYQLAQTLYAKKDDIDQVALLEVMNLLRLDEPEHVPVLLVAAIECQAVSAVATLLNQFAGSIDFQSNQRQFLRVALIYCPFHPVRTIIQKATLKHAD